MTANKPVSPSSINVHSITCGCESSASFLAYLTQSYCHHWASVVCRPSSVVCPSVRPLNFHILINSSEATGPIWTKLWWNGPWMAPFQNCVRWSRLLTKMATKLKIEKRGGEIKKILLLCNYWANLNQTLLKWSLGGPLPKLCLAFQTCNQDGHHSRT